MTPRPKPHYTETPSMPYTPSPKRLSPKPYTLSPKPYTLNPTPYTLNSKPYTLNPLTLNYKS